VSRSPATRDRSEIAPRDRAPARAEVFARLLGGGLEGGVWDRLEELCGANRAVSVVGSAGSSSGLVAEAAASRLGRPLLLVCAHLDDADEIAAELDDRGVKAARLPALEALPGESRASLELVAERLRALRRLEEGELGPGGVLTAPIHALMQAAPKPGTLDRHALELRPGDRRDPGELARWLDGGGYERVETIEEPGEYAVRGGIVDVFTPAAEEHDGAVRLDFFGDELESVHEIDLDTMGSGRRLDRVDLISARAESHLKPEESAPVAEWLPEGLLVALAEPTEIIEQARGYYERSTAGGMLLGPPKTIKSLRDRASCVLELTRLTPAPDSPVVELPVEPLPEFPMSAGEALRELSEAADRAVVLCQNEGELTRTRELIIENELANLVVAEPGYLHRGLVWRGGDGSVAVCPNHELLGRFHARRRRGRLRSARAMDAFLDLEPGDPVVHAEHGVARFLGLTVLPSRSAASRRSGETVEEEFLTLEFAGGSELHVPARQIDQVQKYIGGAKTAPKLSRLGGKRWKRQKEQVAEATRDLAVEMLQVQAARAAMPGTRYPEDTAWQREFEAEFPYEETEDQLTSLRSIKDDMRSGRPMDRLICGDVGFGKTELAIRAAFKAAEYGKQVAVLVPTTVLAEQHERTFRERFAGYPFTVESLSRYKSAGEQREILKRAAKGQVDVLVGTHRLLSRDVDFADLGLVVVDEEQRFGVEHKQALLELRTQVDVLTLSATPIPRTLHMSLLGLRDISSLTTAPVDRRAIVTEVIPWNEQRIRRALERELSREGQVFYVHNRVKSIHRVADEVRRMAPGAEVVVGHGQMAAAELEKVMLRFIRREADILVSTTIIESGVDIPTANTMIIEDADRFGLADLHQLRGRVGRHKHRAYCYLLLPKDRAATPNATRRLKAVEEYSMLGAGFKIAMRDLEIRGAGNLLGAEQSGHIAAVGYEMYCRLLEESVRQLKNEPAPRRADVSVEIGIAGLIPKAYIPSQSRRMEAYRRLALAQTIEQVDAVETDLEAAYGKPPRSAETLLELARLRINLSDLGVRAVSVREPDVIFQTTRTKDLAERLRPAHGTVRVVTSAATGDSAPVHYRPPKGYLEPTSLLRVLRQRLAG
jgi:transcription-repair coupling factor (superfamily II helicase)